MRNMVAMYIRSKFLFKEPNLIQTKEAKLLLLVTGWISKVTEPNSNQAATSRYKPSWAVRI